MKPWCLNKIEYFVQNKTNKKKKKQKQRWTEYKYDPIRYLVSTVTIKGEMEAQTRKAYRFWNQIFEYIKMCYLLCFSSMWYLADLA
jgi:hypothetical protein